MLFENFGLFDGFKGLRHVSAWLGECLNMTTRTPLRAGGGSLRQQGERPQQAQKYDEPPIHEEEREGSSSCESKDRDTNPVSGPGGHDRWGACKTKSSLNRTKRFCGDSALYRSC
jgi:hypothetical protein